MDSQKENLAANGHKLLKPNKFTEQRMPAWRPLLTPTGAIIMLYICGIAMLFLGVIFYTVLVESVLVTKRYDDICEIGNSTCKVELDIPKNIKGNIELKYQLTKFYQNHRRYSFSRVDAQFAGEYVDYAGMANCKPYRSFNDSKTPSDYLLPCGLFAITVFNDTFTFLENSLEEKFTTDQITFKNEREKLFKPLNSQYTTGYEWFINGSKTKYFPDGNSYMVDFPDNITNPHFIVWMRTASLPTVIKTYKTCRNCEIPAGKHIIIIKNYFPTYNFQGTKSVIIAQATKLGTKNRFLGIVYMACGSVCVACATILLISQLAFPRQLGEDRRKYTG